MPKSPQETEEETSDREEDRYYRAERKKKAIGVRHVSRGDSDKENRPPDTSTTEVCVKNHKVQINLEIKNQG